MNKEEKVRAILEAGGVLLDSLEYILNNFKKLDCYELRVIKYAEKYFHQHLYQGISLLAIKDRLDVILLVIAQTIDLTVPVTWFIEKLQQLPAPTVIDKIRLNQ